MLKKNKLTLPVLLLPAIFIILNGLLFLKLSRNLSSIEAFHLLPGKQSVNLYTNVSQNSRSSKYIYVFLNNVFNAKYNSNRYPDLLHKLCQYDHNYPEFNVGLCILNDMFVGFVVVDMVLVNHLNTLSLFKNICSVLIQRWLIEIVVFLVLCIIIFYLLLKNSRMHNQSSKKYLEQQKYIHAERQRISSEMHDEIGAGLSAIKLFSELASKNRKDVDEIRQINVMVNDIANKINEIIWSTNAESDNLESLFDFIEGQSRKLFEHSNISFTASLPKIIPDMIISSQVRRTNYLIVKEVLHNALKHSNATTVHLNINISNDLIIYTVKDNGVGFDPNVVKLNVMGLSNVRLRIEQLNGNFIVENYKGIIISIKIPIKSMMEEQKEKKPTWTFLKSIGQSN